MIQSLWVKGPLPGLNEIVAAAKIGGRGRAYSSQKHTWTDAVAMLAKRLSPVSRAFIDLCWVESARRRDPDNIMAGQKYVLDGLVRAGVLPGDGWAYVLALNHSWSVGREPGVLVTLTAA